MMSVEKTDTVQVAVGIEVATSAMRMQCPTKVESEVFRGACPIGALNPSLRGGERSEHLIFNAVPYYEVTKDAPGFARQDLVLRC